jgi:hypothetical protein
MNLDLEGLVCGGLTFTADHQFALLAGGFSEVFAQLHEEETRRTGRWAAIGYLGVPAVFRQQLQHFDFHCHVSSLAGVAQLMCHVVKWTPRGNY